MASELGDFKFDEEELVVENGRALGTDRGDKNAWRWCRGARWAVCLPISIGSGAGAGAMPSAGATLGNSVHRSARVVHAVMDGLPRKVRTWSI